jgi:hypothetical protein
MVRRRGSCACASIREWPVSNRIGHRCGSANADGVSHGRSRFQPLEGVDADEKHRYLPVIEVDDRSSIDVPKLVK